MKSTMVFWLYNAEQYRNNTPINEIAEHAEINRFNDEEIDVLCLHGYEFIPPADIVRLRERKFILRDVAPLYQSIARRYPNLRRLYSNHFFECFLRWIVLKEFYAQTPILAWDADIFFNEKLSAIRAAFAGSTCTSSSTCFVALHDPRWLEVYESQLDKFERDPDAFRAGIYANLSARAQAEPRQFDGCFFGVLSRAALASREAWDQLFMSTPEEMFVDYLIRNDLLPHHLEKGKIGYVMAPQPLLLPLLAWSHPMGSGLLATCPGTALGAGFEKRDGRYCFNGQPLAFLHFQGAVFRMGAAHQILTRFLDEPAPIFDEFYCPAERRRGRPVSWFFNGDGGGRKRLAGLRNVAELRRQLGDPYSERDVARNFLIKSSLTEAFANYCMNTSNDADRTASSAAGTIMVLTHDPKHPLYASWLRQCPHPVVYETAAGVDFEFPAHVGLVVAHDCYTEPRASLLCRAMERGIPTLLLADGILEYRNTFEHPQIVAGAIFQPVLAHKIACLGRSQARILESWGNATQCEITGSPRFDRYATLHRRQRAANEPFRVLVTTAITPYFTPEQHERVRQSLLDVKAFFARTPLMGGVPLQIEWRITQGMQHEIGVDTVVTDLSGRELADVLQKVDAVISTPSTTMIEAMLLGLPVAVLDYCNCPHYVQPAWRITAEEHISDTVAELVAPPAPKLLFQETTLHDSLECTTPAAPRLLRLAEEMLRSGQRARAAGQPVGFPPRLIPIAESSPVAAENRFDPAALYPGHAQFHERNLHTLQAEIGQLRAYVAKLERGTKHAARGAEREKIEAHVRLTIEWRSKLEAAKTLLKLEQPEAAVALMMDSLLAVQSCDCPDVVLEAVLEVSGELGRVDEPQARALLQSAVVLARRLQRPDAIQRATELMQALPGSAGANKSVYAA